MVGTVPGGGITIGTALGGAAVTVGQNGQVTAGQYYPQVGAVQQTGGIGYVPGQSCMYNNNGLVGLFDRTIGAGLKKLFGVPLDPTPCGVNGATTMGATTTGSTYGVAPSVTNSTTGFTQLPSMTSSSTSSTTTSSQTTADGRSVYNVPATAASGSTTLSSITQFQQLPVLNQRAFQ